MIKYQNFILEHKFWGKSIPRFLNWIKEKSDKYWVLLDTETTGLPSDPYEIQLTQISCIVIKYNYNSNSYEEIDTYNKKLKLSDASLALMKDPTTRIKKVLSFNHYGQKDIEFHDEGETLQDFFKFLKQFDEPILMIQNAEFDMRFLNTRNPIVKFDNEVIDTKQVAQLFYLPLLQKLAETGPEFKEMIQKIGTSSRDNGLISSSLSKIGPALGINMTGYHDALTDCRLMVQMFTKMVEFLKEHGDVDIIKYQAERIKTKR
jgi:DNA polymerase III alpha subunit (gram-positive type)